MGTPRIGRNCLGSPGPARAPAPAATMTTATSGRESPGEVTNALHADYVQTGHAHARARRQEHSSDALPRCLAQAALHTRDPPAFPAQADLAADDRAAPER